MSPRAKTKAVKRKITIVRTHPRRVPINEKNPTGITTVDRHPRRVAGSSLTAAEIRLIADRYDRRGLKYPTPNKLRFKNGNKYDEYIAIWVDYFNKKFAADPPLDPNVIKALIASESGFREDPKENKVAIGIMQITKQTFKILQDTEGEAKDFLFKGIRQKDLLDPIVGIAVGVRWIFRKKETAASKLKRPPSPEEVILEYKGLLRSKTEWQQRALGNFNDNYRDLTRK